MSLIRAYDYRINYWLPTQPHSASCPLGLSVCLSVGVLSPAGFTLRLLVCSLFYKGFLFETYTLKTKKDHVNYDFDLICIWLPQNFVHTLTAACAKFCGDFFILFEVTQTYIFQDLNFVNEFGVTLYNRLLVPSQCSLQMGGLQWANCWLWTPPGVSFSALWVGHNHGSIYTILCWKIKLESTICFCAVRCGESARGLVG